MLLHDITVIPKTLDKIEAMTATRSDMYVYVSQMKGYSEINSCPCLIPPFSLFTFADTQYLIHHKNAER